MEKKPRLGRGLDALLGSGEAPAAATATVPVDQIEQNPFQPRKAFDDDELKSLCESIKNHGILQPLVVRQVGERFQLVAGERRLRAARAAGLPSVPIRVLDFNDQQVLEAALVENIQRSDLNPIEKAQGFADYLGRFKMTHEQLATRLGLARPTITNLVGLLDLPRELQDAVRVGQLTLGHAKILKGITDPQRQVALCKEIIARGLSVHATEALLKQPPAEHDAPRESEPRPSPEPTAHVRSILDELRQKLTVKVDIKLKDKDKGQIVLSFESNDDFERLLEVLRK
jgi:ParB family transcriptional regulator, chromosome partitioning protein